MTNPAKYKLQQTVYAPSPPSPRDTGSCSGIGRQERPARHSLSANPLLVCYTKAGRCSKDKTNTSPLVFPDSETPKRRFSVGYSVVLAKCFSVSWLGAGTASVHSQRVEVPTALNQGWMLKGLSIDCKAMIYLRWFYVDQLTLLVTFELVTFFKLLPHLIIFSAKIYSKNKKNIDFLKTNPRQFLTWLKGTVVFVINLTLRSYNTKTQGWAPRSFPFRRFRSFPF